MQFSHFFTLFSSLWSPTFLKAFSSKWFLHENNTTWKRCIFFFQHDRFCNSSSKICFTTLQLLPELWWKLNLCLFCHPCLQLSESKLAWITATGLKAWCWQEWGFCGAVTNQEGGRTCRNLFLRRAEHQQDTPWVFLCLVWARYLFCGLCQKSSQHLFLKYVRG